MTDKELGTTSVQLRERKNGLAVPKRHQAKHLDFCSSEFGTRGSEVSEKDSLAGLHFLGKSGWSHRGTGRFTFTGFPP